MGRNYATNFSLPGTESQRALDLLGREFPAQSGDVDTIVFRVNGGTLDSPRVRNAMTTLLAQVSRDPHVIGVLSPYSARGGVEISRDRRTAFATVNYDKPANLVPTPAGKPVLQQVKRVHVPGVTVAAGGQVIAAAEGFSIGPATEIGVIAALVILLMTFGSLLAAGMPLVTAGFGLITAVALIGLATRVTDMSNVAPQLALMIGLGVGIDYALFIVTRFRENYTLFGDVERSVVEAMDTSGRAILLAGTTVVIALLGMFATGVSFMYGLAIASVFAVLLTLAASLTVLPAMLSKFGHRIVGAPGRRRRASGGSDPGLADQGGLGLALAAVEPDRAGASMAARDRVAGPDDRAAPARVRAAAQPERCRQRSGRHKHATRLRHAGRGLRRRVQRAAADRRRRLRAPARPPRCRDCRPQSPDAQRRRRDAAADRALGERRRDRGVSGLGATDGRYDGPGQPVAPHRRAADQEPDRRERLVGGFTAGSIDFSHVLSSKLPLFIGIVVVLSALLLFVIFRSLVIPVQAALMNLLSIGGALGVTVAVFQNGWFAGVIGIEKGPIEPWIPVLMFAVIFGLSMDYEVFLVSRVRELWVRQGDAGAAVADGIAFTGRVISAAAAIMICVFLSFMFGDQRVIKEFGFGLAVAVLLDAIVVRCVLLPAVLEILGPVTWRLPRWIDTRLPHINIEGTAARALNGAHVEVPDDTTCGEAEAAAA